MATIEKRLDYVCRYASGYDGPVTEWAPYFVQYQAIIADWNAAIDAMKHARNNLVALIEESQGIAGYHLNGEIAPWDYFEEGDWLGIGQMERALARMEGKE